MIGVSRGMPGYLTTEPCGISTLLPIGKTHVHRHGSVVKYRGNGEREQLETLSLYGRFLKFEE